MTCKDCIHYEVCGSLGMEVYRWGRKPTLQIFLDKFKAEHCTRFKPRSRFVELPDYKYSAEERFRGAVQELIDIAKASETPSKILQATSESLAHFACELSKLEETKQTLKERENSV